LENTIIRVKEISVSKIRKELLDKKVCTWKTMAKVKAIA